MISFLKEEEKFIFNDQNRIKQILINLVGNAIKFQNEGDIKIIVSMFHGYLRLEVLD